MITGFNVELDYPGDGLRTVPRLLDPKGLLFCASAFGGLEASGPGRVGQPVCRKARQNREQSVLRASRSWIQLDASVLTTVKNAMPTGVKGSRLQSRRQGIITTLECTTPIMLKTPE